MSLKAARFIILTIILLLLAGCDYPNSWKAYKMVASSMMPTINKGDRIIANLSYYKSNNPKRGDIVVFRYPNDPKNHWIVDTGAFYLKKI